MLLLILMFQLVSTAIAVAGVIWLLGADAYASVAVITSIVLFAGFLEHSPKGSNKIALLAIALSVGATWVMWPLVFIYERRREAAALH